MASHFLLSLPRIKLLALGIVMICIFFTVGQAYGEQRSSSQPAFSAKPVAVQANEVSASLKKPGNDPSYSYEWETETLAAAQPFVMNSQAVQLDSNNHPHVVYNGSDLYYAWYDGVVWHKDELGVGWAGTKAVLSLDSHDKPHILYNDTVHGNLQYAYQGENGWIIETVDSFSVVFAYSLALDSNDIPHVSYGDVDSEVVRYAYRGANEWVIEDLSDLPFSIKLTTSITLDSQNRPHIAAVSYGQYPYVQYTYKSGGKWIIEDILLVSLSEEMTVFLSLDSQDSPHIAILNNRGPFGGGYITHYAYQTGEGWQVEVVTEGAQVIGMELDSQDIPHLLLSFQLTIQEAYRTGNNQWNYESLPHLDSYYISTLSFQLDAFDQRHIFYLLNLPPYTNDRILEYTHESNSVWHTEMIDASGVSINPSLATDSQGDLHVAFGAAAKLQYGRWLAGRWAIETVDYYIGSSIGPLEFVLDADDVPHILYYDFGDNALKYAHKSADGWVIEEIETEFSENSLVPYSLAVNDEGRPSIIYLAPTGQTFLYELYYAYRDGNALSSEMISNTGSVSEVVLDSQGNPYISYVDYLSADFILAWRTAQGNWNFDTISSNLPGWGTLRLDELDQPHIIYRRDVSGSSNNVNYLYAHKQGGNWVVETIATDLKQTVPLMVLDSQNQPHTTFIYQDSLKYAHKEGNSWFVETIDSIPPSPGSFSVRGIGLDKQGEPYLASSEESGNFYYYLKENSLWTKETVSGNFSNPQMLLTKDGLPAFITIVRGFDLVDIVSKRLHSASDVASVTGGTLTTPNGQTTLSFPAGAFSETVRITMTLSQPFIQQGNLRGIGYEVEVTAVYSTTNEPAQLLPDQTYTLTVIYQHYPPAIEESLALYYWNDMEWIQEISSGLDVPNNILIASSDTLGRWAILGATHELYLPVILHYPVLN